MGWGLHFQTPAGPALTFTPEAGLPVARGGADRNCGGQSGLSGEAPSRARLSCRRAQSGARAMEHWPRGCTVVAAVSGNAGSGLEPHLGLAPLRSKGRGLLSLCSWLGWGLGYPHP